MSESKEPVETYASIFTPKALQRLAQVARPCERTLARSITIDFRLRRTGNARPIVDSQASRPWAGPYAFGGEKCSPISTGY